jgi:general secretion pathway protein E/type IV pilus assembly protein PilB
VRRLCPECKQAYDPNPDDLPPDFPFEAWRKSASPLYRSTGCRACRQVGFRGRMGIYELLITTETVRQIAHERASTWKLKQAAMADGMRTLRQDGWRKVLAGRTTVEEVVRVAKSDRIGGT